MCTSVDKCQLAGWCQSAMQPGVCLNFGRKLSYSVNPVSSCDSSLLVPMVVDLAAVVFETVIICLIWLRVLHNRLDAECLQNCFVIPHSYSLVFSWRMRLNDSVGLEKLFCIYHCSARQRIREIHYICDCLIKLRMQGLSIVVVLFGQLQSAPAKVTLLAFFQFFDFTNIYESACVLFWKFHWLSLEFA